jgi:hypothetical protein
MKLPRFTLRELFLLVALAAMGCGWWVDRNATAQRLGDYDAALRKLRENELMLVIWLEKNGYKIDERGQYIQVVRADD